MSNFILPLVIFFAFLIPAAVRRIARDERGVLFRLGRMARVLEPGLHLVLPFVDIVRKVNIEKKIPSSRALSRQEIEVRVLEIARTDPGAFDA